MDKIAENELHWLAGLLEGEGSFHLQKFKHRPAWRGTPIVTLNMTDHDTVERARKAMGAPSVTSFDRSPNRKKLFRCSVSGIVAAELMDALCPLMSHRRQTKIGEILTAYGPRRDLRKRP